jgi:hypothetical protein
MAYFLAAAGIPAHVKLVPPILVRLALLLVVVASVAAIKLAVAGQTGLDGRVLDSVARS